MVTKGPSSPNLESSGGHDGGKVEVDRGRKELPREPVAGTRIPREREVYRSELGKVLSISLSDFPDFRPGDVG